MYSKRTFSLVSFVRSLAMNAIYMPRFLIALIKPSTSAALREQVMLGCTSVNDCRYCTWLHTNLALKNAVDVDELNEFISNPEAVSLPKKTAVAVLFAQNFSENRTKADFDSVQRLKEEFDVWKRLEIYAYLHAIYLGNLSGNSFDALLHRLRGDQVEGSNLFTEVVVSIFSAPILVFLMFKARNDKKVVIKPL